MVFLYTYFNIKFVHMKTKGYLAFLGCMLYVQITLAQQASSCGTASRVIMNSELIIRENYTSCNKDVTIASTASNIRIYGTIAIHKDKSFRITPVENQTIRIRAYELVTSEPIDKSSLPGDRTRVGWRPGNNKQLPSIKALESVIKIYPNPTSMAITIESEQSILHYKIVNTFGVNIWEGTPVNNMIDVSSLPIGMYELILQTNTTTITKTFIKN